MLKEIDKEINYCNLCSTLVEHFPNSKTVSIGKNNNIVILGEAPANNGWRKSGKAWYDINNKLLPSGIIMQKLLDILNIKLEETYFLESIKCFPLDRKYLKTCSNNCKKFLTKQLEIINPKIVLTLGDAATKSILNIKYKNFKEIIGNYYKENNMIIIPIYHPSPISPMSYKGNIPIFNKIKEDKLF